jgi:predicted Ser/Thr protein kinase
MITFACPACGQKLKVKTELGGKKGNCPHCGKPTQVPLGADAPPPSGLKLTARKAEAAPSPANEETLPPTDGPSGAAPDTQTNAPAAPLSRPRGELYDFLAPPRGPGELGRLGPYRVLKVLGTGGMGVVYRAEDVNLKRPVALKAMLPSMGASPSARQRFIREARAVAAVKHNHIVTVYFVGEERGVPYLAMELLEGEALDARLDREKKPPLRDVLRVGREIAEGLAAAHDRGLIHRDIKPANVWLEGPRASVKILDFGLARGASEPSHITQQGAVIGTPAFMAPEQANGEPVDFRCDLFSLGCVLYRLCSGRLPFQGRDTLSTLMAVVAHQPPPPAELDPSLPPALSDLIMRLLAKKPVERPPSAQAVADELAAIAAERTDLMPARSGGMPIPGRAVPAAAPPGGGRAGLFVALLGLLLLAGAGVFIALRMWDRQPGGGQEGPGAGKDGGPADPPREPAARREALPGDVLLPDMLPPTVLAEAGGGDAKKAPPGLVAYLRKADTDRNWGPLLCVDFSPDGRTLALGTGKNGVVLWDVICNKERPALQAPVGAVGKVGYSPDGALLAATSGPALRVWRLADREIVYSSVAARAGTTRDFAFSPDGKTLAVSAHHTTAGSLSLIALADNNKEEKVATPDVGGLAFSPVAPLLAVSAPISRMADAEHHIHLHALGQKTEPALRNLKGTNRKLAHSLTFSADGALLACSHEGAQETTVFEVATGKELHVLKGHTGVVHAVVFAPTGKVLATCSRDGTVRLWNAQSGKQLKLIRFPNGEIVRIALTCDGRYLAAVGHGSLYVVRLPEML